QKSHNRATLKFRNSLKQNICIDMLRKGYHRSFREVFALIQKQAASGEAPGPGSGIWQPWPLEEQPRKLEQIQRFLTRAEEAQRAGCYEEVYDNQVALARYFEDQEDKWLSDYFYEVCLDSAQRIKMDGGEREAEANFNMGRIYMEQGRLEGALECATASHRLTAGRTWTDGAGRSCFARTCQSLSTIYSSLANKMLENEEHQVAIETLLKAFEMTKEAGDKKIEAEAAYRLGSAYRLVQDHQAARRVSVPALQGQRTLAMALTQLAFTDSCVPSLNLNADWSLHVTLLQGVYDRACEMFQRASEMAEKLGRPERLRRALVHLGIARALHVTATCSSHGGAPPLADVPRLLLWKDSRRDTFGDTRLATNSSHCPIVTCFPPRPLMLLDDLQDFQSAWCNISDDE
uniref:Tetratricopeptide repeat protein 29 n=1 Tax=Paramormyrops kingsleyae TaxID=1676925 RepID=A0A3B3T5U5_9TELE